MNKPPEAKESNPSLTGRLNAVLEKIYRDFQKSNPDYSHFSRIVFFVSLGGEEYEAHIVEDEGGFAIFLERSLYEDEHTIALEIIRKDCQGERKYISQDLDSESLHVVNSDSDTTDCVEHQFQVDSKDESVFELHTIMMTVADSHEQETVALRIETDPQLLEKLVVELESSSVTIEKEIMDDEEELYRKSDALSNEMRERYRLMGAIERTEEGLAAKKGRKIKKKILGGDIDPSDNN